MVPDFDRRGYLLPGIYQTTLEEFCARFDTNSWQAQLFRQAYIRYNIHLFPVPESNERLLNRWIDFFQTDQDSIPRGLVEVEL